MKNKILKKELDYAPVRFRNELNSSFSERLSLAPKSLRKPPKSNLSWELFLSRIEKELLEVCKSRLLELQFRLFVRLLTIEALLQKKADKGLCVVVWDREDYIAETVLETSSVRWINEITCNKSEQLTH